MKAHKHDKVMEELYTYGAKLIIEDNLVACADLYKSGLVRCELDYEGTMIYLSKSGEKYCQARRSVWKKNNP